MIKCVDAKVGVVSLGECIIAHTGAPPTLHSSARVVCTRIFRVVMPCSLSDFCGYSLLRTL